MDDSDVPLSDHYGVLAKFAIGDFSPEPVALYERGLEWQLQREHDKPQQGQHERHSYPGTLDGRVEWDI